MEADWVVMLQRMGDLEGLIPWETQWQLQAKGKVAVAVAGSKLFACEDGGGLATSGSGGKGSSEIEGAQSEDAGRHAEAPMAPVNPQPYKEAVKLFKYMLYVAAEWLDDTTPREHWTQTPAATPPPRPPGPRLHPVWPHAVLKKWGAFECHTCRRLVNTSSKQATINVFFRERCKGATPAARALGED